MWSHGWSLFIMDISHVLCHDDRYLFHVIIFLYLNNRGFSLSYFKSDMENVKLNK